jgi:hypothetical protein
MTDPAPELLLAPVSDKAVIEETYHLVSTGEVLAGPLGFQLAVPRHWGFEILDRIGPLPEKPLVPMARASDPESRAETVILGAHLPREIHPADWLRVFVANKGHEIVDWRERPSKFGRIPDALVRGVGRTEGLGHRLTTIKDANRLFVIDTRMTAPDPQAQEPAYMAMANFHLLAAEGTPYAEPFLPLILEAARPVEILVPGSWQQPGAGIDPPEGGAIAVMEHRREDTVMATMIAVAGAPDGPDAAGLEEVTLAKFTANGVTLTAGPDILSQYDSPDGQMHLLARAWSATRGEAALSVLSAQADLAGVPVALSLVTPSPEAGFEAWAIHRRAFDIAVNSLALA